MFLKTINRESYRYMQIVHSYREGHDIKHKVIAKLGNYDEARYREVKEHLKDWIRMGRAPAVISEIKPVKAALCTFGQRGEDKINK